MSGRAEPRAHRINRVAIEIETVDPALAQSLIERISLLGRRRLAPVVDRVCSELSGPERLDRFDELEIELGPIAVDDFDDDFLRRLEVALRRALTKSLSNARKGTRGRALELVEVFARTGNVPWWADTREAKLIATRIDALAAEVPTELWALLHELADDEQAIERISSHLEVATLDSLIEQTWGTELVARVRVASLSAPANSEARRLRAALLRSLAALVHDGAPAAMRAAAGVSAVAAASGRTQPQRLAGSPLPEASGESSASIRGTLKSVLGRPPAEPAAAPASVALAKTVTHARSGGPVGSAEGGVRKGVEAIVPAPEARPREPAANPVPALGAGRTPTDSLPSRAAYADPSAPSAASFPALLRQRRVEQVRRRAFAQLEQLYVEDAGLVILWPYLDRFFQRVGVVDRRRRFVDAQATMQAIALLEQLACEDPEPDEFRLPLAKLLCGLSPDARYGLERPLTPEQIDECEHLLTAVIGQVPVLHDLALPRFRATFLQRAGMLTTRSETWLLQVERQDHDLVLERFPWSWDWVKLSWMADPLRVEW